MRLTAPIYRILSLVFLFLAGGLLAGEEENDETQTLAFRNLQQLVERENRVLRHARQPDGTYDVERIQRGFQNLVREYEVFIGNNPDYAPGYVAYGLMLDRAGETRIASRMFLRANELDPNIPVVKNQLGNYMVENDRPLHALPYYLAAIELEPEEPLYYYQLGNLLAEYRDEFLDREMYEPNVLDQQMAEAFRKAARLAPDEIAYAYRYAESFYDMDRPDWDEALQVWKGLEENLRTGVERQTVLLQRANIHIIKGEHTEAEALLEGVTEQILQSNKERLLERIR